MTIYTDRYVKFLNAKYKRERDEGAWLTGMIGPLHGPLPDELTIAKYGEEWKLPPRTGRVVWHPRNPL